jgi:REP element-mobilizing transposase RayT
MYERRPRLRGFGYVGGYRYFLTFCTDGRQKVFTNPAVVALVRTQILSAAASQGFSVLAYVFMPDHAHLLIAGTREGADMKSFVHLAKQRSGYLYSRSYRRRLWQPGFYDRVLRAEDATWDVIRYIVDNPVRAGLVARFQDYVFLGSRVMEREQLVEELSRQP